MAHETPLSGGRHHYLPFLREQKGDAASEARRRGFIHSHPCHSHSTPVIPTLHPAIPA